VSTPQPVSVRRLAAALLSVYAGLWLLIVLYAALSGGGTAAGSRPLLRAQTSGLARLQAALRPAQPELSDWLGELVAQSFDALGPQAASERLVWLGETGRARELEDRVEDAPDPLVALGLRRLYLAPSGAQGLLADPAVQAVLEATERYFHEAVLARAGDEEAARRVAVHGARAVRLSGGALLFIVSAALAGIAILLTAWRWLPRLHPRERYRPPDPGALRPLDLYLVFVAWLALFFSVSALVMILQLPPRLLVPAVVLTYLAQALGGLALVHVFLGQRERGLARRVLFGPQPLGARRTLLFTAGGYAVALPVVYCAGLIAQLVRGTPPISENPLIPILLESEAPLERLALLLTVSGLAPVFEEVLFRGLLLPELRRQLGPARAIALSGLLFAAIHMDLPALLPLTALGCVLGYLTHRSGSLLPAILLHALWNAQAFAQIELLRQVA
jgi:membrane protease YdiL (CAAX protease family)